MKTVRIIGNTDVKYKIICAGSSFDVGTNQPVSIRCNGRVYSAKMHSTTKGRIDGLGQLFADNGFNVGDALTLEYDSYSNVIDITTGTAAAPAPKRAAAPATSWDDEPTPTLVAETASTWATEPTSVKPASAPVKDDIFSCPGLKKYNNPACDNEYYNYTRCSVRYKNRYYLLGFKRASIVVVDIDTGKSKDLKKRVCGGGGDCNLTVNDYGIFCYENQSIGFDSNVGNKHKLLCEVLTHDGERKERYIVERNIFDRGDDIIVSAYVVGSVFFAVTRKIFFVYDFETKKETRYQITGIPEGLYANKIVVNNGTVYLRLAYSDLYPENSWWYVMNEGHCTPFASRQSNPIEKDKYYMPYLFPKKRIFFIAEKIQENMLKLTAYDMDSGVSKFVRYVPSNRIFEALYFDGDYMILNNSHVDLRDGKTYKGVHNIAIYVDGNEMITEYYSKNPYAKTLIAVVLDDRIDFKNTRFICKNVK